MTSENLENLVSAGELHHEKPRADELTGLHRSGLARLEDARRDGLSYEGRFDLAYNAAHALALLALRRLGYRPRHRYIVFQALPHTSELSAGEWRVLVKAHQKRNLVEYEGHLDEDRQLLRDLIAAVQSLANLLSRPSDQPEP